MRLTHSFLAAALIVLTASAQNLPLRSRFASNGLHPLDPTREVKSPRLESSIHTPLPEEYIWTADDALAPGEKLSYKFPGLMEKTEPHYFRHTFSIVPVPEQATLYIAGPRSVKVWLNGKMAESVESDTSSPLGMHVFAMPVAKFLKTGKNTIAIEAVRGRGVTGFANSPLVRQQTFGQVMVAKILPSAPGIDGKPLMITTKLWKSSTQAALGWESASFDDATWRPVQSIGSIESTVELF